MKTILSLCVLIAVAAACPTSKEGPCTCSCDRSLYPSIVPASWNVKTFDSQYATEAFQGPWYTQIATPIFSKGQYPYHTGLFSNLYPCSNNRVIFRDTTPENPGDFNTDYLMIDSSFNLYTQKIEVTKSLFKSAYGSDSPLAIFNVGTQKYYPSPLAELQALIDDKLCRHTLDDEYQREYTVAIIGGDDEWCEYMVFAVINQYDYLFFGNDKHIIWMLTRDSNPDWGTYQKAFDDIRKSGLNPKFLVNIDQSIDLSKIPTVTKDDIDGVIETTSVTTSSSSKSISTSDSETSVSSSSSSTTTTTTTVSTVEFTLRPDFTIPYDFGTYDLFGNVQILKNLKPEVIREALNGKYYVQSATPSIYEDFDDARVGLFYTASPCGSLQVLFDSSISTPWDYKTPTMMLDRGYNMITGEIQQTRSMITSTYDGSNPWGVFTVYNEGYWTHDIPELSPLSLDDMIATSPAELYKQQYIASIVGYEKDKYLLYHVANKYKNLFYGDDDSINQMYVFTRERIVSQDLIDRINQDILRSGYNLNYLAKIDQTKDITDEFTFESSYFEYTVTTTSTSTSSSVNVDGVTVESSSSTSSSSTVTASSPDSCGC